MTPIERFLSLVEHKPAGPGRWMAKCPAHDDGRHSLSVTSGENRGVLLRCHAGCNWTDVIAAIGLEAKDLYPKKDDNRKPQIVAQYDYRDEVGNLLYQVVRLEPKSFRQRKPIDRGGWEWRIGNVRRVPYRLDKLYGNKGIVIVEGEKDADGLSALGIPSTTFAGGAGKPPQLEALDALAKIDAEFVLIPDNDEVGIEWMHSIAALLTERGKLTTIVQLPGLSQKQDVSDYMSNHTVDDLRTLIREKVAESRPSAVTGVILAALKNMPKRDAVKILDQVRDKLEERAR